MSVTPQGDHYPMPADCPPGLATRVTRVSGYADGGDVSGLIGWAVNIGAQGAVETLEDWAWLPVDQRVTVAKKRGHQLRATSASTGSKVHRIIDRVIKGEAAKWEVDLYPGHMEALRKFLDVWSPIFIASERTVYGTNDGEHFWAGTADLMALVDDVPCVIDWKTGSPHTAYTAQMGGYIEAQHWSEGDQLNPLNLEGAILVYLRADGTFVADRQDPVHARAMWQACWNLHLTSTNQKEA